MALFRFNFDTYENKGLGIGFIIASILLILILAGLTPITGGAPAITMLFLGLLGCPKYIGKAIDSIEEIKNGGKTNNQKLACFGAVIAGIGLAIFSLICPHIVILQSTIGVIVQAVQIPNWIQTSFLFLGLAGTAAGGADKIGQLVDRITPYTLADLGRWIGIKIKNCFATKPDGKPVTDSSITITPGPTIVPSTVVIKETIANGYMSPPIINAGNPNPANSDIEPPKPNLINAEEKLQTNGEPSKKTPSLSFSLSKLIRAFCFFAKEEPAPETFPSTPNLRLSQSGKTA